MLVQLKRVRGRECGIINKSKMVEKKVTESYESGEMVKKNEIKRHKKKEGMKKIQQWSHSIQAVLCWSLSKAH